MSIPYKAGDRVTLVTQLDDEPVNGSIDTTVICSDDVHCWVEHESAKDIAFDRMTGAVVPKKKGVYVALHTTGYAPKPEDP